MDIHGWTQQIIIADSSSPFRAAFESRFSKNSVDVTLNGSGANGYVAKYALKLGYQSCLFEFPEDTDPLDFYNTTYGNNFIEGVYDLLGI